ncbi:MAG: hypothetical protein OXE75_18590 [bacterium]|nr:hypothetical protein [bacterium]
MAVSLDPPRREAHGQGVVKPVDRPRPPRRGRAPRDCAGGAVSLWVVLMVPALALAGVVAIAVPQRMAAEATVAETADDLATLAVAWREASGVERRSLDGFPPDCDSASDELVAARCRALWQPIVTDLGGVGVDTESVSGFYSDSYVTASDLDSASRLPCRVRGTSVVLDATHVALVADWYGGWAASQVWPDGVRLGGEAVGRLSVPFANLGDLKDPTTAAAKGRTNDCGDRLDVLNDYGEPGWLRADPADPDAGFPGRQMSESVSFRTPFGVVRDGPDGG